MLLVLSRLAGMAATLAAMTLAVFLLQQVIPNDPARLAAGPNAPESVVEQRRIDLGLRDPVIVQYARYVSHVAHGDLGNSIHTGRPVARDLAMFFPASIELIVFAVCVGTLIGLAVAMVRLLAPAAGFVRIIVMAVGSMPIFLAAMGLMITFWYWLRWFPSGGRLSPGLEIAGPTYLFTIDGLLAGRPSLAFDALRHLVLPGVTLALPVAVAIGRTLHSSLVDVMRQNYIRTAFSKGLPPWRVLTAHALRNALRAPLTMLALQFALVFSNLLVVERIFSWPGVGLYMVQALADADLPAVLGVALIFGALYIVFNSLIETAQVWADPRLRRGS